MIENSSATETEQMQTWRGEFGQQYTDRNLLAPPDLDALYIRDFGMPRSEMNREFLGSLPRDIKILEVGSNVGNQLQMLQEMRFSRLYGIELQPYAVELSKQRTKHINIIEGSAFDIPFRDGYFDLVFTSGVLIHLAPDNVQQAFSEMHRCARRYIWGMEYFSPEYEQVAYRGHDGLLWKADYCRLFEEAFSDLRVVHRRVYDRLGSANRDIMYLLEKSSA